MEIEERFWNKIDVGEPDECWPSKKQTPSNRYTKIKINGKTYSMNRVAFYMANGYWPNICRHTCDNNYCCNPSHLVDGTRSDNMKDMRDRTRAYKITAEQAEEIKQRYEQGGIYQHEIADQYGISQPQVSNIVRGVKWNA